MKTRDQVGLQLKIKDLEEKIFQGQFTLTHLQNTVEALLNATSDLALLVSATGIILNVSQSVLSRTGKTREEVLGTSIFGYFESDKLEYRRAHFQVVKESRQHIFLEDQYQDLSLLVCIYPIINPLDEVEKLAIFISDHTELRQSENLLNQYSQILSTIHEPLVAIDRERQVQTVNDAFVTLYRTRKKEIIGKELTAVIGPDLYTREFKKNIDEALGGSAVNHQAWIDFPGRERRYLQMNFYPLYAKKDIISGVVINCLDITKMKEMENELKRLSQTDPLTQIDNRGKFQECLAQEINRTRRYGSPLSLIMFDIDHFKGINDSQGHDVGDRVLVDLTAWVKDFIRETDFFSRWGGEEFMLLLPHTAVEEAAILAEKIRSSTEKRDFPATGPVTCSFGVTEFLLNDTADQFIKRVDQALYKAKHGGRNKVVSARPKPREVPVTFARKKPRNGSTTE